MARIAGVNIPDNKHTVISLTYIFGIGQTKAQQICAATGIEPSVKIKDLSPGLIPGSELRLRLRITATWPNFGQVVEFYFC